MTDTLTRAPFRIEVESAALLTSRQALAVLRAAHARQPESRLVRGRLASALLTEEAFDDAVTLLTGADALDAGELAILVHAHLSRETADDDERVVTLVTRLLTANGDDRHRAQLLADRAKAHRRRGRIADARADLVAALALDPANKDGCKRLASLDLEAGDTDGSLAALDRLAAGGASHSRLHAARALAQARGGQVEASRASIAFDALHHQEALTPPPGFADLPAFNAALAAELLAHPGLRYDRYGSASERTWRVDEPLVGGGPNVRLLMSAIAAAAERHVARIGDQSHPWLHDRPDAGILHSWCVMTDGDGYETWHVHQFGWMSGVYYVQIPPAVTAGDGPGGCIAFGLPEELVGEAAAADYGVQLVRPEEGMLMLFPSHVYHRTFPHGAAERRICVAFDIWPA